MALEDSILSILKTTTADQYSLFRKLKEASMSDISKALANLQGKDRIYVSGYRKNRRTGLDFPIYSQKRPQKAGLDVHPLLSGVTSERLVEYRFVSRNLLPPNRRAVIIDLGCGGSGLSKAVESFGKGKWQVYGIDLSGSGAEAFMDARNLGLRNNSIDQVICVSTIEHVGVGMLNEGGGDMKVIHEIGRILKKSGSAIVSLPYANQAQIKQEYRVYDRRTLLELVRPLLAARKEFYLFRSGKWIRCSQKTADSIGNLEKTPQGIHSAVCACLLLRKRN